MALKIGTLEADITADTSGLDKAEREIKGTAQAMDSAFTRATRRVSEQFDRVRQKARQFAGSFRPMKGVVQQASFQMQDFAVQVGAGTNAMTAFSQQAPQLLSAFGPGGAVVGAIVGVGAAIGASLLPALFQAEEAIDTLEKATDELDETLRNAARDGGVVLLTEKIVELAKESEAAARNELRGAMLVALKALDAAAEGATETLEGVFSASTLGGVRALVGEVGMLGEKFGIGQENAQAFADAYTQFARNQSAENLANLQNVMDRIADTSPDVSDDFIELVATMRDFSSGASEAHERTVFMESALTDLKRALEDSTAELEDSIEVQSKRVNMSKQIAEAYRLERERLAALRAEQRAEQRAESSAAAVTAKVEGLDDSQLEQIAATHQKLRDEVTAQTALTAERKAELTAAIDAAELQAVMDHNEKLLEEDRKLHERRAKEEEAAVQRQAQIEQQRLSNTLQAVQVLGDNINDVLAATGKEGTAVAKAIFLAMKAIQVAQIIAATETAAALAGAHGATMGGLPGYLASATGVRTLGYASAALVAGLAVGQTFGGGRQMGGTVSPQMAHPINEGGVPEILNMQGRQFLLPTGRGGTISPLTSGSGGGQPNVTLINNGTPQVVEGVQVTADEVRIIATDAARGAEQRINASLATGRGDTAKSLQRGFRTTRNLG